jgi:hypothetical protein
MVQVNPNRTQGTKLHITHRPRQSKAQLDGITKHRLQASQGGCPGKGRCKIVDPGANGEEIFDVTHPIFKNSVKSIQDSNLHLCLSSWKK